MQPPTGYFFNLKECEKEEEHCVNHCEEAELTQMSTISEMSSGASHHK